MSSHNAVQPNIERYLPGHWYWVDLHSPALERSSDFYADIFEWRFEDQPAGDGIYRMASIGGQPAAAMHDQSPSERAADTPAYWFCYLTTDDLIASVARVEALGGSIIETPFDAMSAGSMAVVEDPAGVRFALWQANEHAGTTIQGIHGTLCWCEISTTNVDASREFFEGLFAQQCEATEMGPDMTYYVFSSAGEQAFGLMGSMDPTPRSVVHPYFFVDDVDEISARVRELNGSVMFEPHDIPGIGRSAVLVDPHGGAFSVLAPLPRAED